VSPNQRKKSDSGDPTEGREALEEESVGTLAPNPELEEAMREAAEAIEARHAAREGHERGSGAASTEVEELRGRLAETEERLLRLAADLENLRKRSIKQSEDAHRYGHENLVKDLLGTVDNLERAIDHARSSDGGDFESLLQGLELVQRELLAALTKHGVSRIEAQGEPFDPTVHEAMAQLEDGSVPANTVVETYQAGFHLRDRLLRPARVVVSSAGDGEPKQEADGASEGDAEG
jgi:molecular chaperone GrpE